MPPLWPSFSFFNSFYGPLHILSSLSCCYQHKHEAWWLHSLIKAAFFYSNTIFFFHCDRCATSYLHLNTRCCRGFAFSVPFHFHIFVSFFLLSLLSTFEKKMFSFRTAAPTCLTLGWIDGSLMIGLKVAVVVKK